MVWDTCAVALWAPCLVSELIAMKCSLGKQFRYFFEEGQCDICVNVECIVMITIILMNESS